MLNSNWAKSSYSQKGADNCVEARSATVGSVDVRDTQNRELGHLTFTLEAWSAFLSDVRRDHL